jgi:hypothetical protein
MAPLLGRGQKGGVEVRASLCGMADGLTDEQVQRIRDVFVTDETDDEVRASATGLYLASLPAEVIDLVIDQVEERIRASGVTRAELRAMWAAEDS